MLFRTVHLENTGEMREKVVLRAVYVEVSRWRNVLQDRVQ
jgi:hypothetical protein